MISKDDMKLFFSESEDIIQKIEEAIIKLEENPKHDKIVQDLLIDFHSMKGMVGMVGYENLSKFCHQIETTLDKNKKYKDRTKRIEGFINLLFESLDIIRNTLKGIKSGEIEDLDKQTYQEIIDSFEEVDEHGDNYSISFFDPISESELKEVTKSNSVHPYKIYIRIQDTCIFKKVRCFIILRALSKLGRICGSNPEPGQLAKGYFEWDFDIYLLSKESANKILEVLNEILEIENKVVTDIDFNEFSEEVSKSYSRRSSMIEAEEDWDDDLDYSSEEDEAIEEEHLDSIVEDFSVETSQITSVKVRFDILEDLMNNFGEVVILKNQLSQILKERQDWEVNRLFDTMDKHFLEIQETIFKLKLVRVESTFRKYKRLVRDLAKDTGKQVKFELEGLDVEIDRKILEELNTPLIHLLRNAIYHGIGSPSERAMNNKPETGLLRLKTSRQAGSIDIDVSDDGKGLDYEKIRMKLIEKGLYSEEEAMGLDESILNQVIFSPGFTTVRDADMVSGRGMGLAIVAGKVKELGGTLEIYSELGVGTTFRLTVPFTRAILKAQLIKVGGDLFAIPIENIRQIYFFNRELIEYVKGEEYYRLESNLIPVIRLNDYLDLSSIIAEELVVDETKSDDKGSEEIKAIEKAMNSRNEIAIWCQKDERSSAILVVNEVLQQMEVVIKPFRSKFSEFQEILGVSITGDGSICIIIDILNLISSLASESKSIQLIQGNRSS